MIWKKKLKIPITNKNANYVWKQCCLIDWRVQKNTESENLKVKRTKNGRIIKMWSVWY